MVGPKEPEHDGCLSSSVWHVFERVLEKLLVWVGVGVWLGR